MQRTSPCQMAQREASPNPIDVCNNSRNIYLVDQDTKQRADIRTALEQNGYRVSVYPDCDAFLASHRSNHGGCLVVDSRLLGAHGFDLIAYLDRQRARVGCIVMASNATYSIAVRAIKAGAHDFVDKANGSAALLTSVASDFEETEARSAKSAVADERAGGISSLTLRQHQIFEKVLAGHPSKNIAADLGISRRTVENHRAGIARKVGSRSLADLVHAGVCFSCSRNRASGSNGSGEALQ